VGILDILGPVIVALVYISLCSLFKEPNRRSFNAIFIAGAGAAYLSGGFGLWEFVFLAVVTYCAYRGLHSYSFIGVGWLLHTGWDVLHHLYGNPIIPFVTDSSFGCAITDPVIALWCFAGAPSVYDLFRGSSRGGRVSEETVPQSNTRL
jgi:hypothetical protein